MTIFNETVEGILDALIGARWVNHQAVKQAVLRRGGALYYLTKARKYLLDMGFPIAINQRGSLTEWSAYPTDPEQAAQYMKLVSDSYSEALSKWRSFKGAQQAAPTMATYRILPDLESHIISLGRALGKSLQMIATELQVAANTTGQTWP